MDKLITGLKQKEMDRKEFLQFLGVSLLLLTGVAGVMKSLQKIQGKNGGIFGSGGTTNNGLAARGYGSNTYGKS